MMNQESELATLQLGAGIAACVRDREQSRTISCPDNLFRHPQAAGNYEPQPLAVEGIALFTIAKCHSSCEFRLGGHSHSIGNCTLQFV